MKKFLTALLLVACTTPASAQSLVRLRGAASDGTDRNVGASIDGRLQVEVTPGASASSGLARISTAVASSSLVAKAAPGNLYRMSVTTGASAGFLMVFNATTAPADGVVSPLICRAVAASSTLQVPFADVPDYFSTGIVLVFSTTGCFTKTASATAFIEAAAR